MHASDTGSQSNVEGDCDGGSRTHSCYFGPSTVTITRIWEMIDQGYFTEGGARTPGEETILEPKNDEAIVFEEFLQLV
jgi:hypothetical protein